MRLRGEAQKFSRLTTLMAMAIHISTISQLRQF